MTTTKRAKAQPVVETQGNQEVTQATVQSEPKADTSNEVKTASGNVIVRR